MDILPPCEIPEFGSLVKYIVIDVSGSVIIRGGDHDREHSEIEKAFLRFLRDESIDPKSLDIKVLGGGRVFRCERKQFLLLLSGSGKYYSADLDMVCQILTPYFNENYPGHVIIKAPQLSRKLY